MPREIVLLPLDFTGPQYRRFLKARKKLEEEQKKKDERERKRLAKLCTCCPIHGHGLRKLK